MDLSVLAVPEDIKAVNTITAEDFLGADLNYAPESAGIDWQKLVTNYYERLGIPARPSEEDIVVIRDKIFRLCMIAATIEIEGLVQPLCRQARLTADKFPVKYVGGIRHYGKLGQEASWLVRRLLSQEGLTHHQQRIILARYRDELPNYPSAELLMVACIMCLIEDTLYTSSALPISA